MKAVNVQNISTSCLVCGDSNEASLNGLFFEMEDGSLCCVATAQDHHQSYTGRVHGGVVAALLDETIGRAIQIVEPDTFAVTAELSVRFKKPTPLNETLYIVGRVTENKRRLFSGDGEIVTASGEVIATASGRFVKQSLDDICGDGNFNPADWKRPQNVELPDLPIQSRR